MGMTIIKNYGMPHNCYDCDLHNYHECDLTGESIEEDYCWNGDSREKHCPLREVEAIPKADIQKALKEGLKDISENVLAIVREEYISKVDYENRLKADMVAMLTDIQLEIEAIEMGNNVPLGFEPVSKTSAFYEGVSASSKVIQQKINALRGNENDETRADE